VKVEMEYRLFAFFPVGLQQRESGGIESAAYGSGNTLDRLHYRSALFRRNLE